MVPPWDDGRAADAELTVAQTSHADWRWARAGRACRDEALKPSTGAEHKAGFVAADKNGAPKRKAAAAAG